MKGIDVSFYQGTIDWGAVKNDGVQYAYIRVSDGLNTHDSQFDNYWAGAQAAGIRRGAYQFFRPGQDPIAQADYLLQKINNTIGPDDMPPTIDVEASSGLGPAAVASAVNQWIEHVTTKLGRRPVVYTGFYFWRDSVGNADQSASPLWHAQYSSAACPDINSPPWNTWAFWQYTDSGSVAGISGGVDMDRFNGDMNAFNAWAGPPGQCGDGTCGAGETKVSCPEDCGPCGMISGTTMIDNGDACYAAGGPASAIRQVTNAGMNNTLDWTHTTSDAAESNFADWTFFFGTAGKYKVEVYTAHAYAQSKQAKYHVTAAGASTHDVDIDQTAVDGWQTLGTYDFDAGGHQGVHIGDNTGEPSAGSIQLVFDAVQITPVDEGSGSGPGSGPGDPGPKDHGGCNAGAGSSGLLLALAFVGLRRRRR